MNLTVDLTNKNDMKESVTILQGLLGVEAVTTKATATTKKESETTDTQKSEATKPDAPEVTKEAIQKLMKKLMTEQKRDEIVAVLDYLGVKKLSELSTADYPKFYAKLEELV
ncbi:hypothetical protein [Loigolactobacillus backii]|uniref:hypothetical protein n=1 Tax=Loigolactobacillus backii TaxID=375175 RepID=UPI0022FD99BF|nr:hypothetical protein [Loigolactobacillus backii]MDA5386977.1 hypothetical protein [Loigolactobacillus backii]MDA5389515.1 hypothetical protein [Loigolactobacillus backii]